MSDIMIFPNTWEEFEEVYSFEDGKEIYTNRCRLIPSFRVKQWLEHESTFQWIPCSERLPDEAVEVFIYLYGDVPVIAWIKSGHWYTEDYLIDKEDEPIAWMPLPPSYKGRKDGD